MKALPLALSALLATFGAACSKTPPRTVPVVALAIPAPPARTLIPVELAAYVAPEPAAPAAETPPPAPSRSASSNRTTEKPAPPPVAAPDVPTPPVLQTTANPGPLEVKIGGLLGSAEQALSTVNVGQLNGTGRTNYAQARDFIRMSRDNLRIKNYMLAEELATKAESVARLLVKLVTGGS